MNLPTIRLDEVRHVGTMDPSKKIRDSYEGSGLSISQDPEAWRRVADIRGTEWVLSKSEGEFLDRANLTDDHMTAILQWGLNEGLIEECTVWTAIRTDDLVDIEAEMRNSDGRDPAARRNYAIIDGVPGLESANIDFVIDGMGYSRTDQTIKCVLSGKTWHCTDDDCPVYGRPWIKGTQSLSDRMLQEQEVVGELALDLCMIAYSEDVLSVDGVYWEEPQEIADSIPSRGVIHQSKLREWEVNRAHSVKINDINGSRTYVLTRSFGR